jgi:hypothetical protein
MLLKGLGHETQVKFFDKKMSSSRTNEEPLLVFGLLRCFSDELQLRLPMSQRLRRKHIGEIIISGDYFKTAV